MRLSTAREPSRTVETFFLSWLSNGRILNLGAGVGGSRGGPQQTIISVDHVRPPAVAGLWAVGDATRLPFPTQSFDGALLKDVLEHVEQPIAALAEVGRICRPGGTVLITVPRAIPRAVWADPTHLRGFTKAALLQALELGGWVALGTPVRMGGFPGAARLHLARHLPTLMKLPVFGHYFGTNWLVMARLVASKTHSPLPPASPSSTYDVQGC